MIMNKPVVKKGWRKWRHLPVADLVGAQGATCPPKSFVNKKVQNLAQILENI